MSPTETPTKKSGEKRKEPTVEERLDRIEAAIGLHAPELPPEDAVPGEPLKPHQLYAPGDDEDE